MADFKTIKVKLTPKASTNRIGEVRVMPNGDNVLAVYVTAPPDKNKANEAMISLLAKHFGIPQSQFEIIRGKTSRNKIIRLK